MSDAIPLEFPVSVAGLKYDKLSMRRPKVRDDIAARKQSSNEAELEVRLFANLCEVSPAVIEELDIKDYARLQKEYSGFLS